uniref:Natriuretic peptide receptor 3 n=1 Tax=Oncorhynchus kisutch TaxID=8019 RepID=A0A8C7C1H5_ONCKI
MPCYISVCLYIWLGLLPGRTSATVIEDIEVLVMLPKNNSYMFSIARVAPAIEYAKQRLKIGGGVYSGFNFNLRYEDSNCGNDALFSLVDRSCEKKPDLVLGPVCEYAAAPVVRMASHWNIPVISTGALASGFSDKEKEYSHLTRISPSYLKMAETFSAMFRHFNWKDALLIFDDDKEERNCYFTLEGVHLKLMEEYQTVHIAINTKEEGLNADDIINYIYESEDQHVCGRVP